MNARPVLRLVALCAVALLAACESVPVTPPSTGMAPAPADAATPALSGGAAAFERRTRERAIAHQREGRLGEAAVSWEVLVALRPDSIDYRERLAATRRQIDAALPERMQRGQEAWKRGQLDAASTQFLAALALQPDHTQAADALRAIERERNKALYLGKLSRITLARASSNGALRTAKPAGPVDSNDIEHAALLRTQGETDAAIALLERYVAARGPEPTACRMLGEMTLQKAGSAGRVKPTGSAAGPAKASSPCP